MDERGPKIRVHFANCVSSSLYFKWLVLLIENREQVISNILLLYLGKQFWMRDHKEAPPTTIPVGIDTGLEGNVPFPTIHFAKYLFGGNREIRFQVSELAGRAKGLKLDSVRFDRSQNIRRFHPHKSSALPVLQTGS